MPGGYVVPATGDFGELTRVLAEHKRDIAEIGRPSGTQTANLVRQLFEIVNGLTEATDISVSGAVTAGGNISTTSGNISTTSGYFYTVAGYSYDITYTRRAAWLGNDGRLGWASSSVTKKELIKTISAPKLESILAITSHYYERKAEREKRDNPKSAEYRGPDYHVATEWGALAEQLHGLGLWQVVIYDWPVEFELADVLDKDGQPIVNEQGEHLKERVGEGRRVGDPIPVGIHYELLGLLAIEAVKQVWAAHKALEKRVSALERQGL